MSIVIAILNSKGGTGKTTLSTNIAGCLHKQSRRVLLVDSDPQGSARNWHAARPGEADLPEVIGVDRPVLHKTIPTLAEHYDYILIDGAAKLTDITASAIRTSDFVLIPVRHSGFDIWAVEQLVDAVKSRQLITDGTPQAAFVISCQTPGSRLAGSIDPVLSELGFPVLTARTSRRVAYEEAGGMGVTVMDLAGREKASDEIESITREIIQNINPSSP